MGKPFHKYYFKKPDARPDDPVIIISGDWIIAYPGEIVIGWGTNDKLLSEILTNREKWIRFENYFGTENFAPVRIEFIELFQILVKRLEKLNAPILEKHEEEIRKIIETKRF